MKKLLQCSLVAVLILSVALGLSATLLAKAEEAAESVELFDTIEEAGLAMRAKVRARENDFTLAVKASDSDDLQEVLTGIANVAFAYTGHYLEGDTLRFSHGRSWVTSTRPTIDGQLYYQYKIRLDYLTTIYQENQLERLLGDLMDRFDFTGADDASKAFAIYDYLCRNVRFEDLEYGRYTSGDVFYENEASSLKYTAYSALVKKAAVCEGFAMLYYRMALRAGLACRTVTGEANGDAHMWAIVRVNGVYYNVDPSWDAGCSMYRYFLKSDDTFACDHARDYRCSEDAFTKAHPVSSSDYTGAIASVPFASGESDFQYSEVEGGVCIDLYTGTDTTVIIPESIDGKKVVKIGDRAFFGLSALTDVLIPAGVTEIGGWAFGTCTALKNVGLPDGLVKIGEFSFNLCSSLTEISLPDGLKTLDTGCFCQSGLTSLTLPDSLEYVGNSCLNGTSVSELHIPASVTYIDQWLSDTLASITVDSGNAKYFSVDGVLYMHEPDGMCSLHHYPYHRTAESYIMPDNCLIGFPDNNRYVKHVTVSPVFFVDFFTIPDYVPIESITIPADNPNIQSVNGVIYSKDMKSLILVPPRLQLSELVVPEGVEDIRFHAMRNTRYLKKVTLPSTLTSMDFSYARFLESIVFPSNFSMTSIPEACFMECYSLKSITIPASVTRIEDRAFMNSGLTKVTLSEGLEYIGQNAFSFTFLEEISLPSAVSHVGDRAFSDIIMLTYIYFADGVSGVSDTAFQYSSASLCADIQPYVLGAAGSYAETYAYQVGLPFETAGTSQLRSFGNDSYYYQLAPGFYSRLILNDDNSIIGEAVYYDGFGIIVYHSNGDSRCVLLDNNFTITDVEADITKAGHVGTYTIKGKGSWSGSIVLQIECTASLDTSGSTAPTCTEDGFTQRISCNDCKLLIVEGAIPATGHTAAQTIPVPATTTADGHAGYSSCSVCGEALEDIPVISRNRSFTLPRSVRMINAAAFAGTDAQQIIIPAGTVSIDSQAFMDCGDLLLVVIPDSVTQIASDAFSNCGQAVILCSSGSAAEAFAKANGITAFIMDE